MGDEGRAAALYESALAVLDGAVGESPEDPRIHSALGLAYAGLGRKDEAIAAGRRAVEIYPVTRDVMLGVERMISLAHIYARVGDHAAALEQIKEVLLTPGIHTIYHFNLDPRFGEVRKEPGYRLLVREFSRKDS
jgi:tetratricopeptide (TPR) repeat protein